MADWLAQPSVTALMVCTSAARRPYAEGAIRCFGEQTWPFRKMLVVNGTGSSWDLPGIEQIQVKARHLGELKNIALYNAQGEWCLPWGDDCWYAPTYIEFHMLRRHRDVPTVISNPVAEIGHRSMESVTPKEAAFFAFFRIAANAWPQSGDDFLFLAQYDKVEHLIQPPILAKRFFEE